MLTYEELKNYVESAREKGVDLKELFAKDELRNRLASILTESPEGQNDIIYGSQDQFW